MRTKSCARWPRNLNSRHAVSHEHGNGAAKNEAFWDERFSARLEQRAGEPHVHLVSAVADLSAMRQLV